MLRCEIVWHSAIPRGCSSYTSGGSDPKRYIYVYNFGPDEDSHGLMNSVTYVLVRYCRTCYAYIDVANLISSSVNVLWRCEDEDDNEKFYLLDDDYFVQKTDAFIETPHTFSVICVHLYIIWLVCCLYVLICRHYSHFVLFLLFPSAWISWWKCAGV